MSNPLPPPKKWTDDPLYGLDELQLEALLDQLKMAIPDAGPVSSYGKVAPDAQTLALIAVAAQISTLNQTLRGLREDFGMKLDNISTQIYRTTDP